MSDSLERLYQAVLAARDLDPATSRTAKLFQRGPSKMAKKLAEEAIEVVIDAVNGDSEAMIRESADLLYNLTVLWASAGVRPRPAKEVPPCPTFPPLARCRAAPRLHDAVAAIPAWHGDAAGAPRRIPRGPVDRARRHRFRLRRVGAGSQSPRCSGQSAVAA